MKELFLCCVGLFLSFSSYANQFQICELSPEYLKKSSVIITASYVGCQWNIDDLQNLQAKVEIKRVDEITAEVKDMMDKASAMPSKRTSLPICSGGELLMIDAFGKGSPPGGLAYAKCSKHLVWFMYEGEAGLSLLRKVSPMLSEKLTILPLK